MAFDIYRGSGSLNLPASVTGEILAKTQDESAVMRLARRVEVGGTGAAISVVSADPEAAWVGETDPKPVDEATLATKILRPYKIAIIEPFSKEFVRDADALYNELVNRLPGCLAKKFDSTVIGNGSAPGSDFDQLDDKKVYLGSDSYAALVEAYKGIAENGGVMNGIALGAQGAGEFIGAVDDTGRPLFTSPTEGGMGYLLGAPVYMNKGIYIADDDNPVVGIAGDWSKALYGTVNGVEISISDQATLTAGTAQSPATINLWQNNMVAVRAEIEIGFRADTDCFYQILKGTEPTA